MSYIGRFAPSPTGPLHFGSLLAALASWLDARAARGSWLVRIEDLDRPRNAPGAADAILRALEKLGLEWDGAVEYQSRRLERYRAALEALGRAGLTYPCACSRREIADSALAPDGARIYPGTCRAGLAPGRRARATRVRVDAAPLAFDDRVQGRVAQRLDAEVGDFVVGRADGTFAYQLAVVVDDAAQGVTDVVRGADLLGSTPRQIFLQRALGLATPRYLHVPVALDALGDKLSKQTGAAPLGAGDAAAALAAALGFLGQDAPRAAEPRALLAEAARHWDPARVPARRALSAPL